MEGLTPEEIAARQAAALPPEPTPEERISSLEAANLALADALAGMYELMLGGGML